MARGWESKSIESQQAEASAEPRPVSRRPLTPDELAAQATRRTLELARARTRADLKSATAPAHREMLSRALEDIESRLRELALVASRPTG
ncbi:MAG: hypothetical protein IMZ67_04305 [Acidobacteria bacterium]|nr:hypothetical protein [Acidobacteriota bacterium]